jgi:hypothetical protein
MIKSGLLPSKWNTVSALIKPTSNEKQQCPSARSLSVSDIACQSKEEEEEEEEEEEQPLQDP